MAGSGIFAKARGIIESFTYSGIGKEISDLREDTRRALQPVAALTAEEFTNVAVADVDGIALSRATVAAAVTLAGASLSGVVGAGNMVPPRNVTVTCSDSAATWAGSITVSGYVLVPSKKPGAAYIELAVTETIALTNNATTAGAKLFSRVTSVAVPAQVNTSGAYSVGFGTKLGLAQPIKSRAGALQVVQETEAGTVTTGAALSGTFTSATTSPPHGAVVPGTDPNGTNDYAYIYEYTPQN